MSRVKYYSVWFAPSDRWTVSYYPKRDERQVPNDPFCLTYEEAQRWCWYCRIRSGSRNEFEVREIPNAEELVDRQRRKDHADKYL